MTQAAVRAFQATRGLVAEGEVGPPNPPRPGDQAGAPVALASIHKVGVKEVDIR